MALDHIDEALNRTVHVDDVHRGTQHPRPGVPARLDRDRGRHQVRIPVWFTATR
jgi:hypothetical protein